MMSDTNRAASAATSLPAARPDPADAPADFDAVVDALKRRRRRGPLLLAAATVIAAAMGVASLDYGPETWAVAMEVEATCSAGGTVQVHREYSWLTPGTRLPRDFVGLRREVYPAVPRDSRPEAIIYADIDRWPAGDLEYCTGSVRCRLEVNGLTLVDRTDYGPFGNVRCAWDAPE